ncbi:DUF6332 family protein [Streptomyces sp. NPDC046925]|uniref:DUF6332 family protein n=1 Tax=Streptomyces sp. NPDC046925 TaxID=3155375 RepID=UPI0033E6C227
MDMGRESRWEKDAMSVEIVFALVTAALLAAVVYAAAIALTLAFGISGPARGNLRQAGLVAGAVCGVWRVVRVLRRFDAQRRLGR